VNVERVKDLFVYLVQDSGAIFSAASRARDLDADDRSVRQWLRLLEDTHLVTRVEQHAARPTARLRSQPRVYASDHGLIGAFSLSPAPVADTRVRSRLYEAVVFRHLRAVREELDADVTFLRFKDDLEVDFVVTSPTERTLVEVTSSSTVPSAKVKRVAAAGQLLKAERNIVVHGGPVEDRRGEIHLVPLLRFLLDPRAVLKGERES
jgi:predicted AAA+ superfamily ATPase